MDRVGVLKPILEIIYTPHVALICSRVVKGPASPENFDAFWNIFRPKCGRFLFLGTLNGGGGAKAAPPLDLPLARV